MMLKIGTYQKCHCRFVSKHFFVFQLNKLQLYCCWSTSSINSSSLIKSFFSMRSKLGQFEHKIKLKLWLDSSTYLQLNDYNSSFDIQINFTDTLSAFGNLQRKGWRLRSSGMSFFTDFQYNHLKSIQNCDNFTLYMIAQKS